MCIREVTTNITPYGPGPVTEYVTLCANSINGKPCRNLVTRQRQRYNASASPFTGARPPRVDYTRAPRTWADLLGGRPDVKEVRERANKSYISRARSQSRSRSRSRFNRRHRSGSRYRSRSRDRSSSQYRITPLYGWVSHHGSSSRYRPSSRHRSRSRSRSRDRSRSADRRKASPSSNFKEETELARHRAIAGWRTRPNVDVEKAVYYAKTSGSTLHTPQYSPNTAVSQPKDLEGRPYLPKSSIKDSRKKGRVRPILVSSVGPPASLGDTGSLDFTRNQQNIKALQTQLEDQFRDEKAIKTQLPYTTIQEVDSEIIRLEKEVDSGKMRLADEKKALSQISKLEWSRNQLRKIDKIHDEVKSIQSQIAELSKGDENAESSRNKHPQPGMSRTMVSFRPGIHHGDPITQSSTGPQRQKVVPLHSRSVSASSEVTSPHQASPVPSKSLPASSGYFEQLVQFHKTRGRNLNRSPSIYGRPIDFPALKTAVEAHGGFQKVCQDQKWAEIGSDLGYWSKITPFFLESSFQQWLQPYEDHLEKQGKLTSAKPTNLTEKSPQSLAPLTSLSSVSSHNRKGEKTSELRLALQYANAAVSLDEKSQVDSAIWAYSKACEILHQLNKKYIDEDSRRKLNVIMRVYETRINQLKRTTSATTRAPIRRANTKFQEKAETPPNTIPKPETESLGQILAVTELSFGEFESDIVPWRGLASERTKAAARSVAKVVQEYHQDLEQKLSSVSTSLNSDGNSGDDSEIDADWAEQLQEMGVDLEEISSLIYEAEKFSPWIPINQTQNFESPYNIHEDFHLGHCPHFPPPEASHDLRSVQDPVSKLPASHARLVVERTCGLAGVVPLMGKDQRWLSEVVFEEVADTSTHVALKNSDVLDWSRIRSMMQACVHSVSWMQQNQVCCDSYTALRICTGDGTTESEGIVEMVRVRFSLLCEFQKALTQVLKGFEGIKLTVLAISELLETFYGSGWSINIEASWFTIFKCALVAAQSCCLSIVLYMHGHGGPLKMSIIDRPLERVVLAAPGTTITGLRPGIKSARLTCIGDMLQTPVMAFYTENPAFHNPYLNRDKYNLYASPSDMMDTWGPAQTLWTGPKADPTARDILSIVINSGNIAAAPNGSKKLHWTSGYSELNNATRGFALNEKVVVAGPTPNEKCSLTPLISTSHPQACEYLLHRLGTRPDRWELAQKQFGLQGGQYLQLCANLTYQKKGAITLKDCIVSTFESGELSETYLEDSWGLQISFCTGVCRRVPLRVLLADCVEAFGDDRLGLSEHSQLWRDLKTKYGFCKNLASPTFHTWFADLPSKLQAMAKTIIVYAIGKLQDTGYNDGKFVVAWPCAKDAFRCIKLPCKGPNYWMKVLADDDNCATFACVTPTCLERKDHQCMQANNSGRGHICRKSSDMRWNFATVAMNTMVCCQLSYDAAEKLQSPWSIEERKLYMMGKPDLSLCATISTSICPEKHLVVKKLSLPSKVKSALAAKARLLERQSSSSSATAVLLLADGSS